MNTELAREGLVFTTAEWLRVNVDAPEVVAGIHALPAALTARAWKIRSAPRWLSAETQWRRGAGFAGCSAENGQRTSRSWSISP